MISRRSLCRLTTIVVLLSLISAGIEGYNTKGHWPFSKGTSMKTVKYNLNLYNLIPSFREMFGDELVEEAIDYIDWAAHAWSCVPNQILWLTRGEDVDFCDYDNSDYSNHTICTKNIENKPGLLMYVEIEWDPWDNEEILDADLIINDNWMINWTLDPEDNLSIDFPSVLLHEFGHFCGLGDNPDACTVMYHKFDYSRVKRELSEDDMQGLVSLYSIKRAADGGDDGGGGVAGCFSETFNMFSSNQDYSNKGWLWSNNEARTLTLTREQASILRRLDALGIDRYHLSKRVKEVFVSMSARRSLIQDEEAAELKEMIFGYLARYGDYLERYFQGEDSRQTLVERTITEDDISEYREISERVSLLIDDVRLLHEIRESVKFLEAFKGSSMLDLFNAVFVEGDEKTSRDGIGTTAHKPESIDLSISPNPFHNKTRIELKRFGGAPATVAIFDVAGRKVRGWEISGTNGPYIVEWDGTNARGRRVASGIYYCVVRNSNINTVKKIILIR